jgi:hypothetical protein
MGRNPAIALILALVALGAPALAQAKTGTVTLNCPVPGATVLVDGAEIGTVPIEPFDLRFGHHVLKVVRPGLIEFEEKITLRPNEQLVVNAFPKEPRALLTIHTPVKGGEVLVDGKSIGPLPIRQYQTMPGKRTIFIRREGLLPHKETVFVPPHREHVLKPALMNRDGTPAGGLLALDLDDDDDLALPAPAAKAPAKAAALDLDLDLDLAPAKPGRAAPPARTASLDLDLDDDLPLAPPAPAKPVAVAVAAPAKAAPAPPAATAPAAPPPAVAKAPDLRVPPKLAEAPKPKPAFVPEVGGDDQLLEEPVPFYQRKWVWGATASAVVLAIAVPIATGRTGGYVERRDPGVVCSDCLAVINR